MNNHFHRIESAERGAVTGEDRLDRPCDGLRENLCIAGSIIFKTIQNYSDGPIALVPTRLDIDAYIVGAKNDIADQYRSKGMLRTNFFGLRALFHVASPRAAQGSLAQHRYLSGPTCYGNLAVYFVHDTSDALPVPRALQEAVDEGAVAIRETGNVNELKIENIGADEVFAQSGDIVKGGLQDRVLSTDLLLPPRSGEIPLTVFCVESGRWRARGAENLERFSCAKSATPSHAAKVQMRAAAREEHHRHAGPTQAKIWAEVNDVQSKLAKSLGASVRACASESSLQLSLENDDLKAAQAPFTEALKSVGESGTDTVGVAFVINGKIKSSDIYASNVLFGKLWPKLLSVAATDAIGAKGAAATLAPTLKNIERFLGRASSLPESERKMNHGTRLAMRQGDGLLYAELRRSDGTWVHRNYLAS